MVASFKATVTEDAPATTEDNTNSSANVIDMSDESCVFSLSPARPRNADSDPSTGKVQKSAAKPDIKQENVWDLITRIRYIKSRLDRAESDYRKKRMLKTIVVLQKRVKAIVKGMHNKNEDPANGRQEANINQALSGPQSVEKGTENAGIDSQGTDQRTDQEADQELQTNNVITDEGKLE